MLNNSDTWDEIDDESVEKLERLQNTLMCYLLSTPRTTPKPALCWDFGVIPVKYRILQKKLNLVKHLSSLNKNALAKEVYQTQLEFGFPGLATQTKQLIKELDLPDITENKTNEETTKQKWKKLVKEAIVEESEKELKEKISKLKKLKDGPMKNETFGTKDYLKSMDLTEARLKFKFRSKMLDVKMNYSHDPVFSKDLWKCDSCERSIDTQNHILWCPAYSEIREGKSLNNDEDLISYLKKVMNVRDKLKLTK